MKYTIDSLKGMRGFGALTQGDCDIENMLVKKSNELNGKVKGFKFTREHCLEQLFDNEALTSLAELSVAVEEKKVELDNMMNAIGKQLCERVLRDHVPLDMVKTFCSGVYKILTDVDDSDKALDMIKKYVQQAKPVSKMYIDFEEFAQKGVASLNGTV
jgi:hypothetical protein